MHNLACVMNNMREKLMKYSLNSKPKTETCAWVPQGFNMLLKTQQLIHFNPALAMTKINQ